MSSQFEGKRHIPFTATAEEKRHGRDTRWELRAKEAPDHIKEAWPGSAWIVELFTTKTTRKGTSSVRDLFITTIRTTPEALLRLSASGGASKTNGTGPATRSSVRMPTATPTGSVHRCFLSCEPW